jgi:putative peptidoglycan lipid II flippase
MPGLFFIALNRILAPAFYAQSDSKSPTLAGILSFAVNIVLAALLVGPMRGSGVALALTIASAANTGLLLIFLGRNPNVAVGRALGPVFLYTVKIIIFSCIAAAPVFFFAPYINAFCKQLGGGRIIAYGLPLAIQGLGFALIGVALLVISKDKQIKALAGIFRRRKTKIKEK